ncbi:MAG: hypothetical protein D6722_13605 [Bacteroidetes bacterium]|nr:MAG: hypothetical protein D6722_13605 [Bacteroidota bacterium]
MYTGLLHSHRLVVILFLLLYVIKLGLLLLNREEALAKLTRYTRIPEMVLSVLFLLTGGIMLTQIAQITPLLLVKIGAVLASIPLAVIGFRKKNKLLGALSVLLILGAYGMAEANKIGVNQEPLTGIETDPAAADYDQGTHGLAIYARNCAVCHGADGTAGGSGAKNLQVSTLSDADIMSLLMEGKNSMPAYAKVLNEAERKAVLTYVKTLRKQ